MSEEELFKGYPVKSNDIKYYISLDIKSNSISKTKNTLLILFAIVAYLSGNPIPFLVDWFEHAVIIGIDFVDFSTRSLGGFIKPYVDNTMFKRILTEWCLIYVSIWNLLISKITPLIWAIVIHTFLAWGIHTTAYRKVIHTHRDWRRKPEIPFTFHSLFKHHYKTLKFKHNYRSKLLNTLYILWHSKSKFAILSLDYFFAIYYKKHLEAPHKTCSYNDCNRCKESGVVRDKICFHEWDTLRIKNKYFIQLSNWHNIIAVVLLGFITIVSFSIKTTSNNWLTVLMLVVIFRIISRFVEISIAFYKDAVEVNDKIFRKSRKTTKSTTELNYYNKILIDNGIVLEDVYIHRWKNSMLLKSGRISLAVHSLIEVILLFSLFYCIGTHKELIEIDNMPVVNEVYSVTIYTNDNETYIVDSIKMAGPDGLASLMSNKQKNDAIPSYWNFLLYSASVTFMNISFDTKFLSSYLALTHVTQVLLNLVIIVLSIATYIGLDNKLSDRESNFYIRTHTEKFNRFKFRTEFIKLIIKNSKYLCLFIYIVTLVKINSPLNK
jgi:hypothetical protein